MSEDLRLLLVEDNEVDQMAFERFVAREGLGYSYRVATSISEAREALLATQYDIVLMDYMLSDGTAFDLLDLLEGTPSLITTGTGDERIAVDALRRGVYDYLVKDPAGSYLTALPIVVQQSLDRWNAELELKRYQLRLEEMVAERTAELEATSQELRWEIEHREQVEAQLRQSEAALNEAQEIAQVGSYVWDLQTDALTWSRHMFTIAGLDPDTFSGNLTETINEMIHPDDRISVQQQIAEMVKTKHTRAMEFRLIRPDGDIRWLRSGARFIIDAQGIPIQCIGVHHDITERKAAEQKQTTLVRNLESAQRLAHMGSWEWEIEQDTAVWSDELFRIYGRDPQLGAPSSDDYLDHVHPDDRGQLQEAISRSFDTGHYQAEYRLLRYDDGAERVVLARGETEFNAQGQPTHHRGMAIDMTERRQTEASLRRSEERHRLLFENASLGIGYYDLEGNVVSFNEKAVRDMGGKAADYVGKSVVELYGPQAGNEYLHRIRVAASSDETQRYEDRIVLPGGTKWFLSTYTGIRDDRGTIVGVQIISTDITEQKHAELVLDSFFDQPMNLHLIAGFDGTIQRVNTAWHTILGYTKEDLADRSFLDLVHPEDRATTIAEMRNLRHGQPNFHLENRYRHQDGSYRLLAWSATASPEDQRVYAVANDITERTRAVDALKQSETRLRRVVENMPVMMDALDEENRIITWNRECERVTGYSAEEMLGSTRSLDILYPDRAYREKMLATYQAAGNNFRDREWTLTCKDGSKRTVSWSNISNEFPIPGWFSWAIGVDVTDRVQAEAAREKLIDQIREQALQMEQILATVPAGVVLLNADGRVLQANPAAVRDLVVLTGVGPGEVLTHLGDRDLPDLLTSPPTAGLWHEIEAEDRVFEAIARPVAPASFQRETHQDPEHWVLVITEVTRERQIRQTLHRQERMAAVGQLAAGIAHDFNNILASIVLYTQMAAQAPEISSRTQGRLSVINQQAWHATRLIEQILDFSRRAVLERQPLDLQPLLKEQVKLLRRTLPENVVIELVCDPDVEYIVDADPTRMQQMITNLAVNARDAMPYGGTLRISMIRVAPEPALSSMLSELTPISWVRLTVSDTGTGIMPEVLPHIFEPFFTTKGPGEGSGLGLAQVDGIVGQHGGHIEVDSEVGVGTSFIITLPTLTQEASGPAQVETNEVHQGHGETILVVEDSEAVRTALVESLREWQYDVLAVCNGEQALDLLTAEDNQIALVLSDVVMPVMGGIALFRKLKELGQATPVILLTGHPMHSELDALREQGLADWMAKPPSLQRLGHAIASALYK